MQNAPQQRKVDINGTETLSYGRPRHARSHVGFERSGVHRAAHLRARKLTRVDQCHYMLLSWRQRGGGLGTDACGNGRLSLLERRDGDDNVRHDGDASGAGRVEEGKLPSGEQLACIARYWRAASTFCSFTLERK